MRAFRRLATSAAVLAVMAIPTGLVTAGAGVAHAGPPPPITYGCGTSGSFANEDAGYWITSNGRSSPNDDVFASDSYGTTYPVLVGASPTGSYADFGLWDICWTTSGSNSTGYYGEAAFYNTGSGYAWAYDNEYDNATSGDTEYYFDFQCQGSSGWTMTGPQRVGNPPTGYYSTYLTLSNVEVTYAGAPTDTFTEVNGNGSPRFCT